MPFESRFAEAADAYQRYRPDYPPALYQRILAEISPQRRIRAMDLGAGTGIVAGHLAEWFQEVIAVEPDGKMAAKIAGRFPQIAIRNSTAEENPQAAESVDLITIANALHWMEPEKTFANARKWLKPDGLLAVFDRRLPKANAAIDRIALSEFRGPWKPHRDPRLKRDLRWQDEVHTAPGFQIVDETKFPNVIPMTVADYTGFWRSTSYGSAYAHTLADPERYWQELESRFATVAKDDIIFTDFSPTLVLARKA
jgi:SAM-dependent methyltransferase